MMLIEILEVVKSGDYICAAGEVREIEDETAKKWCARGWARDPAGVVPTGARVVLNAKLEVQPASHGQAAQEA
jgi:hypothetical protein